MRKKVVRFLLTFFLGWIGSIIINHSSLKPDGYTSRTSAYIFATLYTFGIYQLVASFSNLTFNPKKGKNIGYAANDSTFKELLFSTEPVSISLGSSSSSHKREETTESYKPDSLTFEQKVDYVNKNCPSLYCYSGIETIENDPNLTPEQKEELKIHYRVFTD